MNLLAAIIIFWNTMKLGEVVAPRSSMISLANAARNIFSEAGNTMKLGEVVAPRSPPPAAATRELQRPPRNCRVFGEPA